MAIQKSEAFVLKTHPFRSSSLIVTTFSRSFGKIKGVAKGVRKEGLPHPATFEPFTLLEIVFYEKIRSEIHLISEAALLESFDSLRADLEVLATAYHFVELVDHLTEPHDPHEKIFELLHFAFQSLPSVPPGFLARFFEVRLLHEVGLLPHLQSCVVCGEKEFDRVYFSSRQGAVFCPRCRQKSPESRQISRGVLETLRKFAMGGASDLGRYAADDRMTKEMGDLMEAFLAERVGRRLPGQKFLNQVRALKIHSIKMTQPTPI